jgi:hypothetical protein
MLGLNGSHKAYADAIMQAEAYKLFKRKPVPSTKSAEMASYAAAIAADRAERRNVAGYKDSWSEATAKRINQEIKSASKKAVKAAGKTMVKKGKLVAQSQFDISPMTAIASLVAAAVLPGDNAKSLMQVNLDRRAVLALGTSVAAVALVAPGDLWADNKQYIAAVREQVAKYAATNAPNVIRNSSPG